MIYAKIFQINSHYFASIQELKGKFSNGIEGALASTLNRDFNWKQLSEMILWIFFGCFQGLFE